MMRDLRDVFQPNVGWTGQLGRHRRKAIESGQSSSAPHPGGLARWVGRVIAADADEAIEAIEAAAVEYARAPLSSCILITLYAINNSATFRSAMFCL
jgi:hypothetical protein